MLRIFAAGVLVVWLAAVALCSTECLGEDSHAGTGHMEKAATSGGPTHDSDSHDDTLCVSMHSLCPAPANTILIKPDFGLAFTPDFISSAQIVEATSLETSVPRQPPDRNWAFTPEVCLGPAIHSLAPPIRL